MQIMAVRQYNPDPKPIMIENFPNCPNSWACNSTKLLEVSALHPYILEEMGEEVREDAEELEYFLRRNPHQLVVDLVYYKPERESPRTVHCVTDCKDQALVLVQSKIQDTVRRVVQEYDLYIPPRDLRGGSDAVYFVRSGLSVGERRSAKAVCIADCLCHAGIEEWTSAMERLVDSKLP